MKQYGTDKETIAFLPQRPGLAYQCAFDWLAGALNVVGLSIACLARTSFAGIQVLQRLPNMPFLAPLPDGLSQAAATIGLRPVVQKGFKKNGFDVLVWVDPEADMAVYVGQIAGALRRGGRLYVVAGGSLARFLAEHRQGLNTLMSASTLLKHLNRGGFRFVSAVGWYGPRAIAWHYLGSAAERLGRDDWADRCHYAMRRSFTLRVSWPWPVALVGLVMERIP